jgi:hypothetical protein
MQTDYAVVPTLHACKQARMAVSTALRVEERAYAGPVVPELCKVGPGGCGGSCTVHVQNACMPGIRLVIKSGVAVQDTDADAQDL